MCTCVYVCVCVFELYYLKVFYKRSGYLITTFQPRVSSLQCNHVIVVFLFLSEFNCRHNCITGHSL